MDHEDQGASGRDPDGDWTGDVEGDGLRGWISPDDRLWRHPSELAGSTPGGRADMPELGGVQRNRAGIWIIGSATACFVLALVAAGLMVSTTGGNPEDGVAIAASHAKVASAPTTEAGAGTVARSAVVDALVDSLEPSLVTLSVTGVHGTSLSAGLVAESGGMIVTAAAALAGARSITAIEADGTRSRAGLIGTDPGSGLAVVRVADDLPAVNFVSSGPTVGTMAMAMSLDPSRRKGATPSTRVYAGTVTAVGPTTHGMSGITVAAPLAAEEIGCPLIATNGGVSGLLETVQRTGDTVQSVFVPAQLVHGVVNQLVSDGRVEHGWLGVQVGVARSVAITTTTATQPAAAAAPSGAVLDAVVPGSPAAGAGLVAGDVIVAVGGDRVRSSADLETSLYADAPGATVEIDYRGGRTGRALSTWVTLVPGVGAPVLSSSP